MQDKKYFYSSKIDSFARLRIRYALFDS